MLKFVERFIARTKSEQRVNRLEGFTSDGAVVIRDSRGKRRAEIPNASTKSETLGDDPLAIYKPAGAKHVDAAKAMGNFTGWTFAAVNAIASEVSNIQFRLYHIKGEDHQELGSCKRTRRCSISWYDAFRIKCGMMTRAAISPTAMSGFLF
jgi:hypothetical protein